MGRTTRPTLPARAALGEPVLRCSRLLAEPGPRWEVKVPLSGNGLIAPAQGPRWEAKVREA